MARGTTLGALVVQLKHEMGLSGNAAHSVNMLDSMKYKLAQVQERLWAEYDWSFLKGSYDVAMAAGQRYYDLPVDGGRIERVDYQWTDIWTPLEFGIGPEQYNQFNGDETYRYDPAMRWDFYESNQDQFEVWPVPAADDNPSGARRRVRFKGVRRLNALVAESDRCDLDDQLIVLFTAAALITDKEKAPRKLNEANGRLMQLQALYRPKTNSFSLKGQTGYSTRQRPGPVRVAKSAPTTN